MMNTIIGYIYMGQAVIGLILASLSFVNGFQVGPLFAILGQLASLTAGTLNIIAKSKMHNTQPVS